MMRNVLSCNYMEDQAEMQRGGCHFGCEAVPDVVEVRNNVTCRMSTGETSSSPHHPTVVTLRHNPLQFHFSVGCDFDEIAFTILNQLSGCQYDRKQARQGKGTSLYA